MSSSACFFFLRLLDALHRLLEELVGARLLLEAGDALGHHQGALGERQRTLLLASAPPASGDAAAARVGGRRGASAGGAVAFAPAGGVGAPDGIV